MHKWHDFRFHFEKWPNSLSAPSVYDTNVIRPTYIRYLGNALLLNWNPLKLAKNEHKTSLERFFTQDTRANEKAEEELTPSKEKKAPFNRLQDNSRSPTWNMDLICERLFSRTKPTLRNNEASKPSSPLGDRRSFFCINRQAQCCEDTADKVANKHGGLTFFIIFKKNTCFDVGRHHFISLYLSATFWRGVGEKTFNRSMVQKKVVNRWYKGLSGKMQGHWAWGQRWLSG